jgi:hypothetical protein
MWKLRENRPSEGRTFVMCVCVCVCVCVKTRARVYREGKGQLRGKARRSKVCVLCHVVHTPIAMSFSVTTRAFSHQSGSHCSMLNKYI